MYRWSTQLAEEVRAALDADLGGPVLRGIVEIACGLSALLNPRLLPSPPTPVIAALCENLAHWVVAVSPRSPYCHLRPPLDHAGLTVATIDLRRITVDSDRPASVPKHIWPTIQRHAAAYRATQAAAREGVEA